MKDVHRKRLLTAADIIEDVPACQFNMRAWMRDDPKCGTIGCAAGWAAQSPKLPELEVSRNMNGTPYHGGDYGFLAIRRFFGLSGDESEDVFSAESYASRNPRRSTVARRMRQYAESKA